MRDINLIPGLKEQEKKRESLGRITLLIIPVGVILFLSLSAYGYMTFFQHKYLKEQTEIEKKIDIYSTINAIKGQIGDRNKKIDTISKIMDSAYNNSIIPTHTFDSMVKTMPKDLFVLAYTITGKGEVSIIGRSKSYESISYFIYRLTQSGAFNDVQLSEVLKRETALGEFIDYNFNMTLRLTK